MTKSQNKFYVSKGEQQLGPWSIQDVAAKVASNELAVTDFIFDDVQNDWVALFQCEAFQTYLKTQKPKVAPTKKSEATSEATSGPTVPETQVVENAVKKVVELKPVVRDDKDGTLQEWFVQKGQHRYGPFTYLGVVRALQEKTVYEFDLCWKDGMTEWIRIAEHEEFRGDRIRQMTDSAKDELGVFTQRRHPRVRFESEVLVHDNRSVWLGRAFEGSAGGSGLVIENATLVPGQTVLLHFAEREDLPAFNALCEIVGKKFTKDVRDSKSPVQYSVRFVKLDAQAESRVQKYFLNNAA